MMGFPAECKPSTLPGQITNAPEERLQGYQYSEEPPPAHRITARSLSGGTSPQQAGHRDAHLKHSSIHGHIEIAELDTTTARHAAISSQDNEASMPDGATPASDAGRIDGIVRPKLLRNPKTPIPPKLLRVEVPVLATERGAAEMWLLANWPGAGRCNEKLRESEGTRGTESELELSRRQVDTPAGGAAPNPEKPNSPKDFATGPAILELQVCTFYCAAAHSCHRHWPGGSIDLAHQWETKQGRAQLVTFG